MNTTPIVLNFESKKTPGDIYQIVLRTLDDMVQAIEDKKQLEDIRLKAMDIVAITGNKLYRMTQTQPNTDEENERLRQHNFWKEGI